MFEQEQDLGGRSNFLKAMLTTETGNAIVTGNDVAVDKEKTIKDVLIKFINWLIDNTVIYW